MMKFTKQLLRLVAGIILFLSLLILSNVTFGQNVGIGTTVPDHKLHVVSDGISGYAGAIKLSAPNMTSGEAVIMFGKNTSTRNQAEMRFSYQGNTSTSNRYEFGFSNIQPFVFFTGMERVGIATNAPTEKLDVNGQIRMRSGAAIDYIPVSDANGVMTWTDPATITTADDGDWALAGNDMYNANSGNVGIGTTSPASKLEVEANGTGNVVRIQNVNAAGYSAIDIDDNNGAIRMGIGYANTSAAWNPGLAYINVNSAQLSLMTQNTSRLDITTGGNVGIGTAGPSVRLDVDGQIRMRTGAVSGYVPVSDGNGVMTWTDPANIDDGDWLTSGNDIYKANTGNVGIGTSGPAEMVHIQNAGTDNYLRVDAGGSGTNYGGIKMYENGLSFGWAIRMDASDDGLYFSHESGGVFTEKMIINQGGSVGIGTTGPSERLDVNGQIRMRTGASDGYVPVSDADGVMSWTDPSSLSRNVINDLNSTGFTIENQHNNYLIYENHSLNIASNLDAGFTCDFIYYSNFSGTIAASSSILYAKNSNTATNSVAIPTGAHIRIQAYDSTHVFVTIY